MRSRRRRLSPFAAALAWLLPFAAAAAVGPDDARRYLVERTFSGRELEGCDAAAKRRINDRNAALGVRWVHSYVTADQRRSFCVYEAPDEAAVRAAARANGLPVDRVIEVPLDLIPGPQPRLPDRGANHRYVVERTFSIGELDGLDAEGKRAFNARNAALGVRWVHSYANADRTRTFCIYEGPSEEAVRQAAVRNAIPIDRIVEVPRDLAPR